MNDKRSIFSPLVSNPLDDDPSILSRYRLDPVRLSKPWVLLAKEVRKELTQHFEALYLKSCLTDDLALFLMNQRYYRSSIVSLFCCLKTWNIVYDDAFLPLLSKHVCSATSLEAIVCQLCELGFKISDVRLTKLLLMRDREILCNGLPLLKSLGNLSTDRLDTLLQHPNLAVDPYLNCLTLLQNAGLFSTSNEERLLTLLPKEFFSVSNSLDLLIDKRCFASQPLLTMLLDHHDTAKQIAEGLQFLQSRGRDFHFELTLEQALTVIAAKERAKPTANALSFLILGKMDTPEHREQLLQMKQAIEALPILFNQLRCNAKLLPEHVAGIIRVASLFADSRLIKALNSIAGLNPLPWSRLESLLSNVQAWSDEISIEDKEKLIIDCVLLINPHADYVIKVMESEDDEMRLAHP